MQLLYVSILFFILHFLLGEVFLRWVMDISRSKSKVSRKCFVISFQITFVCKIISHENLFARLLGQ